MLSGHTDPREDFVLGIAQGFSSRPYRLHPRHFYDQTGSVLFEEITRQPEYYLTRVEASILERSVHVIEEMVDDDVTLVELGSGSSTKTRILIEGLLASKERLRYLPIDISTSILYETAREFDQTYPELSVMPIASPYEPGISAASRMLEETQDGGAMLVLFLGSSIGNMEPEEAVRFLTGLRRRLGERDKLLVGFDLVKEKEVLNAAYNDEAGVTARFNLNLLTRINRELGGGFDLSRFSHRAFYDCGEERIEMHLVSETRQEIRVEDLGIRIPFESGETIHTESSYKYRKAGIAELASRCHLRLDELFTDENNWFALALLSPLDARA
jgi:dimethylhistidine N-methyltransferase